MHFIRTISNEDAEGKLKDVYESLEGTFGMVPSIFQSQSLMPDVLESVDMFLKKLMIERHSLTKFQKELIATHVSKINLCPYCIDAHTAMAMAQGYTKEQVAGILDNLEESDLIDQQTKGLLRLAEKTTRNAHKITKEDIDILKALGLDDEEILEAIYVASGFNMINRLADALGTPLDNFVESMNKGTHI